MNKIARIHQDLQLEESNQFSQNQIEILKNSLCKNLTDEEFGVFLMACNKTHLDPFMRQIYAVKRGSSMTIQTGIDGYRLIAERTGKYSPGQEPTYVHDKNGTLVSSTSYVKKMTSDGTWHTVSSSAYLSEYCQRTREGKPMGMWNNMPLTMLAKCAEAQALRKAFPAEMSGIYTKEEMMQAEVEQNVSKNMDSSISEIDALTGEIISFSKISSEQSQELLILLSQCKTSYADWFYNNLKVTYKIDGISGITENIYEKVKKSIQGHLDFIKAKQQESTTTTEE